LFEEVICKVKDFMHFGNDYILYSCFI